jgi:hypothetical protein
MLAYFLSDLLVLVLTPPQPWQGGLFSYPLASHWKNFDTRWPIFSINNFTAFTPR